MDNNVFASACFDTIIDEIKECGFAKGAKYKPANEYDVAMQNLQSGYNIRGYLKKMISIYDEIAEKLDSNESGEFYIKRENLGLLYPETATLEAVNEFDSIAKMYYDKKFKHCYCVRFIDFNQGVDARLVTDEKMKKLSEINIRPLRIASRRYWNKVINKFGSREEENVYIIPSGQEIDDNYDWKHQTMYASQLNPIETNIISDNIHCTYGFDKMSNSWLIFFTAMENLINAS